VCKQKKNKKTVAVPVRQRVLSKSAGQSQAGESLSTLFTFGDFKSILNSARKYAAFLY